MLRFGLWICGLSVVMAALTFGAMLRGQTQPIPVKLQKIGFDLCSREPCFKGITPGITTWENAQKLMASEGADIQKSSAQMTIGDVEVLAQKSGNTVTLRIDDYPSHNELPSLGYFVNKYGTPCSFIPPDSTTGFPEAFVSYPFWDLIITVDNNRVEPNSVVETVRMFDWAVSNCPNIQDIAPSSPPVVPWLGFTSIDHYMTQAVEQNQ